MGYFNINLDNDITYMLQEIGHNCRINNVVAKAIINNSSMERTFDDKKIITNTELGRGNYIEYNNLFFILLNEVNDKRYLSYYKGIMRRCNFDIKFIVQDKLYIFPSIIEGDKFFISESKIIDISADTLSVTLPSTTTTKQLSKLDCFIKFGEKWEIQGVDYTSDGLIVLHCKITNTSDLDDLENEIAKRWVTIAGGGKEDRLKGNVTPIQPFDTPIEPEEPIDPEEPEPTSEITYLITVEKAYPDDDENEIYTGDTFTYTIHKFVDGVEFGGIFTYELSDSTNATITLRDNSKCKVTAKSNVFGRHNTTLIVTDAEREVLAIERVIIIVGK